MSLYCSPLWDSRGSLLLGVGWLRFRENWLFFLAFHSLPTSLGLFSWWKPYSVDEDRSQAPPKFKGGQIISTYRKKRTKKYFAESVCKNQEREKGPFLQSVDFSRWYWGMWECSSHENCYCRSSAHIHNLHPPLLGSCARNMTDYRGSSNVQ